ncbi:MAG: hypothetical protein M0Q93_00410 [Terrimicrobiaceae bacterium]|nr:hypothetical protein [Terrimicrobiaceae bacterium]
MKAGDITELESLRDWMEPGSVRRAVLDRVLLELDPKNRMMPAEQDLLPKCGWASVSKFPDFRFDEEKFYDCLMRLVQQHQLHCEELTGYQIASALGKALKAGDFQRVVIKDSQQVYYQPGLALSRLQIQYNELIMAVGSRYENETRHETALRYPGAGGVLIRA